jgi:hypothetical protein
MITSPEDEEVGKLDGPSGDLHCLSTEQWNVAASSVVEMGRKAPHEK